MSITHALLLFAAFLPQVLQPITAGPSRCFRAVPSEQHRSYLLFWPNGTYQRAEVEAPQLRWLDQGSWRAVSKSEFELRSDLDAWALETPRLDISPGRLVNVPLVRELKQSTLRFLREHQSENTFSYDQVFVIQVLGGPCPDADSYICRGPCDGPRSYGVNVQPKFIWPDEPITRAQLHKIATLIDSYVGRSDLNLFHMFLVSESGFRLAYFDRSGVGYTFRAATEREARKELRTALQLRWPDDPPITPMSLVEVPCSTIESERQIIPPPTKLPQ